jgi:hypothetical protein
LLDDNKQYVSRDAVSHGGRGGAGLDPRAAQSIYLGRLIRGGGIIVLDDYQLPGVARAASFCITNPGRTLEEVSTPNALHQWAVLRTTTKPKERPFDYFIDF